MIHAKKISRSKINNRQQPIRLLEESTGLDPWVCSAARVKEELIKTELVEVTLQDRWRLKYLASLLKERQMAHYLGLEEKEKELSDLIDSLCVN